MKRQSGAERVLSVLLPLPRAGRAMTLVTGVTRKTITFPTRAHVSKKAAGGVTSVTPVMAGGPDNGFPLTYRRRLRLSGPLEATMAGPMGHNHLPTLPMSIRWKAVVESLHAGAPIDEVCALSVIAAERDLHDAADDPVYQEAMRLLCLIPQAARGTFFADGLRAIGLRPGDAPDLTDVVFAATDRLDEVAAGSARSDDFPELTRRALERFPIILVHSLLR